MKSGKKPPVIYVLAGVNGSGKSSIGERIFAATGSAIYNPDTIAARIAALHPDISSGLANGHAWQIGRALLEEAIREGKDYRFETTLGGNTITRLLQEAAEKGHLLNVWFCGLSSPELHLQRVRSRVAQGGHDIPEEKIRERWNDSRMNLIRLLPVIHHLRLYDNSIEGDPAKGQQPQPSLLLEIKEGRIVHQAALPNVPEWAQPIFAASWRLNGRSPKVQSS
jgi:predicted ABC-type ATPase